MGRKLVKRLGFAVAVAIGTGVFFAAQASSFQIIAPNFQRAPGDVVASDDDQGGSDGSRAASSAASGAGSADGPAVPHVKARGPAGETAGLLPVSFTDAIDTMAQSADRQFSDAPALDDSTLSTAPSQGTDGGQTSGTFASSGDAASGGSAGLGGGLGGGGGLAGAQSGIAAPQPETDASGQPSDGGLNGLQPPQGVLTSLAGVPEPATWTTLILGFGLMGVAMRRRRRTAHCAE